jgi:hypothetical protein
MQKATLITHSSTPLNVPKVKPRTGTPASHDLFSSIMTGEEEERKGKNKISLREYCF